MRATTSARRWIAHIVAGEEVGLASFGVSAVQPPTESTSLARPSPAPRRALQCHMHACTHKRSRSLSNVCAPGSYSCSSYIGGSSGGGAIEGRLGGWTKSCPKCEQAVAHNILPYAGTQSSDLDERR